MKIKSPPRTDKNFSKFRQQLGRPLFRFLFAGLIAALVTTVLLLFMRFLIMGYDDSATDALTRYFTLKTIVLPGTEEDRPSRVERPAERPELPGINDYDFSTDADSDSDNAFVQDNAGFTTPTGLIESNISLPSLDTGQAIETPEPSTREKLKQLKQGLLESNE